jgi:alginate O-acetyltransferase complex protein AlgJ
VLPRLHPAWTVVLVVAFVAAILTPGAVMVARLDREAPGGENRELARPPVLGWRWMDLRALPGAASAYFEDHFGLRGRLVRWQAWLRLRVFHVSASPDVILGRDGWLFYAGDGGSEDLISALPFTSAELEKWRETLQHTHDWLAARGIAYIFVLAPDKHAVYPEFLPASVHRVGLETRTDALVRYLREHSTVRVVDLRPTLHAAKTAERLYHRTDTHWNDRGAFVAYTTVMQALGRSVAGEPAQRAAFDDARVMTAGMDLARMLGLSAHLPEEDLPLVPLTPRRSRVAEPRQSRQNLEVARLVTEQADSSRPRAVIFRDSFASALIPFLSEHFSRAVYLWQHNMAPDVVMAEQPRVVIQEWVGRHLSTVWPYDPFADAPP